MAYIYIYILVVCCTPSKCETKHDPIYQLKNSVSCGRRGKYARLTIKRHKNLSSSS